MSVMETITQKDRQRFESKVYNAIDGCHYWTGCLNKLGYGEFYFNRLVCKAHRAAFRIYKGDIPDGLQVLHSCDNRACVNPDHLFLGTAKDNMIDMTKKGRHCLVKGSLNGRAKLTEVDVFLIREAIQDGCSREVIMKHFHIDRSTVNNIVRRKLWKHI
jgi:hypothetical protein